MQISGLAYISDLIACHSQFTHPCFLQLAAGQNYCQSSPAFDLLSNKLDFCIILQHRPMLPKWASILLLDSKTHDSFERKTHTSYFKVLIFKLTVMPQQRSHVYYYWMRIWQGWSYYISRPSPILSSHGLHWHVRRHEIYSAKLWVHTHWHQHILLQYYKPSAYDLRCGSLLLLGKAAHLWHLNEKLVMTLIYLRVYVLT